MAAGDRELGLIGIALKNLERASEDKPFLGEDAAVAFENLGNMLIDAGLPPDDTLGLFDAAKSLRVLDEQAMLELKKALIGRYSN